MACGNVIKKRLAVTLSLLLGCASAVLPLSADTPPASLATLTFITEEYPPYNYQEDGRVMGTSVRLLEEMMIQAGLHLDHSNIHYYPWVRGYELALSHPNTVLFSTTRTPTREAKFHWVGPIAQDQVVLLARHNTPLRIHSLDDAIDQELSVAVIREDIGAQALVEAGYPEALIRPAMDNHSALHMLLHGRVDLWAYSADVAKWIAEQEGYSEEILTPLYTLSESYLYFALNPETDPQLVAQLQQAFERVTSFSVATQVGSDG